MVGERAGAVFGETLRRHLCLSNCGNETPWKLSQFPKSGHPFLWRPAMQGFGEDHTDPVATRDSMLTLSNGETLTLPT
jgi:hypothetical protein